ncbi:hypothetical protein BP5796_12733 [Coleophoma crateriformis]|uniref:Transcription factor domain-containing protein n=1 Tax=Coleophoma crateriformis TaxID=565419 RepID=A0A3D8Q637_9HELO|nr:hypothetical protein BP5796_12733 [Coleophoma crateriformis]
MHVVLPFVDETKDIEKEYDDHSETLLEHELSRGDVSSFTLQGTQTIGLQETSEHPAIGTVPLSVQIGATVEDADSQAVTERIGGDAQLSRSSRPSEYLSSQVPRIPDVPIYSTGNNVTVIHVGSHGPNQNDNLNPSSGEVLRWPINDHIKAGLLTSYFQDASKWCEVTDSLNPFSTGWSHLVVESQAFAAAAVALASMTRLRRDSTSTLLVRELYLFARETLQRLKSEHHEGALFATILLCMACSASEKMEEEQEMLHDCVKLLQSTTLNNVPDGILSACFWAVARQGRELRNLLSSLADEFIDIWAAYLGGRSTLISPETWITVQGKALHAPIQDRYSNQAISITARIIDELSKRPVGMSEDMIRNLWAELQIWIIERPPSVRCIMEVEASGDSAFPTILFSNPSAGMKASATRNPLAY